MPGQFDLRPVSEGGPYKNSAGSSGTLCGNVRRMGDGPCIMRASSRRRRAASGDWRRDLSTAYSVSQIFRGALPFQGL